MLKTLFTVSQIIILLCCLFSHTAICQDFGRVDKVISEAIQNKAFPSACIFVKCVKPNRNIHYSKAYGKLTYNPTSPLTSPYTLYDVASLTKPLATLLCVMKLYEQGFIDLEKPITYYLPDFTPNPPSVTTATNSRQNRPVLPPVLVKHLLLHNSGLIPFRRYDTSINSYKKLITTLFNETLIAIPGERTIYSDLNFLLLQEIVIRAAKGTPFDNVFFYDYFKKNFIAPLNLSQTLFAPDSSYASLIAPTDSLFQAKVKARQPLVHDPTAAIASGIAGNAGLFSTATQIASLASIFLENGTSQTIRFFTPETIALFTKKITDRTLGLDTKTSSSSMCGKYFSCSTYGHLGFTGTSFWIDPERKLLVVLLTNRVFPSQTNKLISKFRPLIHDAVIQTIDPNAKPLN